MVGGLYGGVEMRASYPCCVNNKICLAHKQSAQQQRGALGGAGNDTKEDQEEPKVAATRGVQRTGKQEGVQGVVICRDGGVEQELIVF